jgi:hypothetical protein
VSIAARVCGLPLRALQVPEHHGQKIIEVMRNTCGEPTNGLHLGRMPQAFLHDSARGDVAKACKTRRAMVPRRFHDPDFRIDAIASRPMDGDFCRISGDEGYADGGTDQQLGRPAKNLLRSGIGEQYNPIIVYNDDPVGILLDEEPDFRLIDAADPAGPSHTHSCRPHTRRRHDLSLPPVFGVSARKYVRYLIERLAKVHAGAVDREPSNLFGMFAATHLQHHETPVHRPLLLDVPQQDDRVGHG